MTDPAVSGDGRSFEGRTAPYLVVSIYAVTLCPNKCAAVFHIHGAEDGEGDGHRVSHCADGSEFAECGYVLRRADRLAETVEGRSLHDALRALWSMSSTKRGRRRLRWAKGARAEAEALPRRHPRRAREPPPPGTRT